MRILMVSTELWPLAKVGGLADMVASLSATLRGAGHDVRCALPAYNVVPRALPDDARVVKTGTVSMTFGGQNTAAGIRQVESESLPAPVLLIDHAVFRREGIYDDPETRQGYPDNGLRWALFCRAVRDALPIVDWWPDVVHAHDHQAAPLLGLLRWTSLPGGMVCRPAGVFTIHNVGYQGVQPSSWIDASGLPPKMHYPTGPLEFHGNVNLMKIGIRAADRVTTVSPQYAREIASGDEFGMGLHEDLAAAGDRLTGILNGIDTDVWNPESDPHLRYCYSADRPANKSRNRSALREESGLDKSDPAVPLLAMVTRLTSQKGIDLAIPVMEAAMNAGMQFVVLGSGEARYESELRALADRRPGRLAVTVGFDEPLAHRIEAGADIFLMPSRYEPCGLNQMYSLRYGTVPVVRAVGGLADTVLDLDEYPEHANGFVFRMWREVELFKTIHRAARAWRNRRLWKELMQRGMTADLSWNRSTRQYLDVYEKARADAGRPGAP
jgi:starch synthase